MKVIEGEHSLIEVFHDQVVKKDLAFAAYGCTFREAYWLTEMRDSLRTPRLYRATPDTLWMEWCGEPLTKENLPVDWRDQAVHILQELEAHRCCHNDIQPGNLLVRGTWLNLIDFGWATMKGQPIPAEWPRTIGSESYHLAPHKFSDGYSMHKTLEMIEAQ